MNRRQFFKRTAGAVAVAALLPFAQKRVHAGFVPLRYRNKMFFYDKYAMSSQFYYLNPHTLYVFKSDGVYALA